MMMLARAVLLAIFVVAGVAPWSAACAAQALQTGNDLLTACRLLANNDTEVNAADGTADDPLHLGICFGEIEALNWLAPGVYDPNLRSCVPADITTAQMAKVIVQYLGRRPERLREPFEGLALEALAHSCRARGPWVARVLAGLVKPRPLSHSYLCACAGFAAVVVNYSSRPSGGSPCRL